MLPQYKTIFLQKSFIKIDEIIYYHRDITDQITFQLTDDYGIIEECVDLRFSRKFKSRAAPIEEYYHPDNRYCVCDHINMSDILGDVLGFIVYRQITANTILIIDILFIKSSTSHIKIATDCLQKFVDLADHSSYKFIWRTSLKFVISKK